MDPRSRPRTRGAARTRTGCPCSRRARRASRRRPGTGTARAGRPRSRGSTSPPPRASASGQPPSFSAPWPRSLVTRPTTHEWADRGSARRWLAFAMPPLVARGPTSNPSPRGRVPRRRGECEWRNIGQAVGETVESDEKAFPDFVISVWTAVSSRKKGKHTRREEKGVATRIVPSMTTSPNTTSLSLRSTPPIHTVPMRTRT